MLLPGACIRNFPAHGLPFGIFVRRFLSRSQRVERLLDTANVKDRTKSPIRR